MSFPNIVRFLATLTILLSLGMDEADAILPLRGHPVSHAPDYAKVRVQSFAITFE